MIDAKIYFMAAKTIDDGSEEGPIGSCEAIAYLTDDGLFSAEARIFSELFSQYENPDYNPIYWGAMWSDDDDERKECRVLALCFMAAIAEDEV